MTFRSVWAQHTLTLTYLSIPRVPADAREGLGGYSPLGFSPVFPAMLLIVAGKLLYRHIGCPTQDPDARALAHSAQERNFVDFEFPGTFVAARHVYGTFAPTGRPTGANTYFHFGPDLICYGQRAAGQPAAGGGTHRLDDVLPDVGLQGSTLQLPFNPSDIVDNLRYERYVPADPRNEGRLWASSLLQSAYYLARPFLALSVRKHLQRVRLRDWEDIRFPQWPVDPTVEGIFEELMALTLRCHSVINPLHLVLARWGSELRHHDARHRDGSQGETFARNLWI